MMTFSQYSLENPQFDFATLIFLLLVRHSLNKFILCPYFVRRFPPINRGRAPFGTSPRKVLSPFSFLLSPFI